MGSNIAVLALGGNAVEDPSKPGVIAESRICMTAEAVGRLLAKGYDVVVTHGNGPQVGELQEALLKVGSPISARLDVLVAMTQGELGYLISKSVRNATGKECIVLFTSVTVSPDDPAFENPTKPVGRYLDEGEASRLGGEGWVFKQVSADGKKLFRRVVPSPKPLSIVGVDVVRSLLSQGYVVVACGGGGIPVVVKEGLLEGVDAVIDKDLASSLLAVQLDAALLVVLTAVDAVMFDYGKPTQRPIMKIDVGEARRYLSSGVFDEGTIAPKIEACINFTEKTRMDSLITSPEKLEDALAGSSGTRIVYST